MNAVALDMALGGSTNTALHLPAIAASAGVPLSLDDFDRMSAKVPTSAPSRPRDRTTCSTCMRRGDHDGMKTLASWAASTAPR